MLAQYCRKIIFPFITILLLLNACTASRETPATAPRQQPAVEPKEKAPLAVFESSFRPSDFDEEVKAAEKRVYGEPEPPILDAGTDSVSVEETIVQGFRIQIFASAKIDEANLARQTAAEALSSDSLYVVYDPPVYKVRVGDYLSRFDANRALVAVIQRGYPDAWIVNDQIIRRTFTRIKREEY